MIKTAIASVVALAMVAGASAPAAARGYWGGGYGHHRGGGDTFGNILLGGVLVGGAVAIANASKNSKQQPVYRSNGNVDLHDAGEDARQVASMCSDAVEGMARSRNSTVDSVGRDGDGWRVEGVVQAEHGDRHFACGARDGNVDYVNLDDKLIERR